jgi:hypothetical protein
MFETDSAPNLQKTAVIWSHRKERNISVRIYYDVREQDGCKVYTVNHVEEL